MSESSYSWVDNSSIFDGANLYGVRATGAAPGTKSIWNSTSRIGGNPGKSSRKTSGKSRTVGTSSSRFSFDSSLFSFTATPSIDKGKGIATKSDKDPSKRLVPALTIIRPDPDEQVRVEFMINGKKTYLTKQEIQEYLDKDEKMKKAVKEEKLLAMSRPEVIKVVHEEAKKLGTDLKEAISTKAGETFKKAQDAEHEVLKKEHSTYKGVWIFRE
ncbi:hypothetical protein Tco_1575457 [Tanacetum coccineum]